MYSFNQHRKATRVKPTDTINIKFEVTEEWLDHYIMFILQYGEKEIIDIPELKELNEELLKYKRDNL